MSVINEVNNQVVSDSSNITTTISQIPREVVQYIFSLLPLSTKSVTVQVCHEWTKVILENARQEEQIYIKSLSLNIDVTDKDGLHHNAIFSLYIYQRIDKAMRIENPEAKNKDLVNVSEKLIASGNIVGAKAVAQTVSSKETLAEICEIFISYNQLEAGYELTKNFQKNNMLEISYLNKLLLNISFAHLFRGQIKQAEKIMHEIPAASYRDRVKKTLQAYQRQS
jgi:hypothetical protein